ncbi:T9SS type B sorting domain-containing protein [Hyunsoonleella sp. 2307UL5-6]|uniref:T9SS type B sorting domain-containing protein n=1 Tax=Hyunsoonleella sp. 2307UL5-6 TaxID=3384768 RepID=UPI0039BC3706
MKNTLILILLCITTFSLFAQKQAANWYFGQNAGITFNDDGTVSELTDGSLSTAEGCTTISDTEGNLLFYTDGITVWDRLHRTMPNANQTSGGLFGDPSSTQSAIVIPQPNNESLFYVFTVDTRGPNDSIDLGFNYSIVDMRLNNGFGDIVPTAKNINLRNDSSEKISAVVKDCESQELWVITFGPSNRIENNQIFYDTFYAYQVTDSGINTTPVVSPFPSLNITDPRGYLKFSPDGTKIACANVTSGLYLYDFDVNTGQVSNQTPLQINSSQASKPQSAYGLEFSQSNELLYVTAYYDAADPIEFSDPNAQFTSLIQYDITATDVSNSAVTIDERVGFRGGLQLGIDGRIYRAMSRTFFTGSPNLSVINAPNARGLDCNYQHNKISLSRNSTQGLPPFITSFFTQKIDIIGDNDSTSIDLQLCDGDTFRLEAPNLTGATYEWTRNGNNLTNTESFLDIENGLNGLYSVLIDLNTGRCEDRLEGVASVSFTENPSVINAELIQCDEDGFSDGLTVYNLEKATTTLTGSNNELMVRFYTDAARTERIETPSNFANSSSGQVIYVEVYNIDTLCSSYAELTLSTSITDAFDTLIAECDDDGVEDGFHVFNLADANDRITNGLPDDVSISYYKTYEDALTEKNTLDTSYTNTTPFIQNIYARVESDNNCFGISTVNLIVDLEPQIEEEALVHYCTNFFPETIRIDAGPINGNENDFTYNWSTGATTYSIDINTVGRYTVTITNAITSCASNRVITVDPSNEATITSIEVIDVTQNNTITINVTGEGLYQYSIANINNEISTSFQDGNTFENVKPGIYTVFVRDVENNCGTVDENISVIGFPKFFTPNNDGQNDTWQIFGVSAMFQPNTKILIFNRYGKLVKEISPLGEGWDGILNGQVLPADDYWFSIQLQDGRVFKDHFTLKI